VNSIVAGVLEELGWGIVTTINDEHEEENKNKYFEVVNQFQAPRHGIRRASVRGRL
jgi:hypothetical protein